MPENKSHPKNWKYTSPDEEGFHTVVSPENSACKVSWVFRLNLPKGKTYNLANDTLELNGTVVSGKALLGHNGQSDELTGRDAFYLPAGEEIVIKAQEDLVMFIGGGPYEGVGHYFVRKYDLSLPLGDIHQIHGKHPYQREVFMTLAQQDAGSRLICGITEGENGR